MSTPTRILSERELSVLEQRAKSKARERSTGVIITPVDLQELVRGYRKAKHDHELHISKDDGGRGLVGRTHLGRLGSSA